MESLKSRVTNEILNVIAKNASKDYNTGFVAGSFPAYVWLEYQGIIVPKYNDIDIFTESKEVDDGGAYRGIPVRIKRTSKDGIFNSIEISDPHSLETLVEQFDFNACMCGLDLATGYLHVSDELKQFAKTEELEVVNITSPLFTALRLVKKHHAGFKCKLDRQMRILSQGLTSTSAFKVLKDSGQLEIKKDRLKGLINYIEHIKPYFLIKEDTDTIYIHPQPNLPYFPVFGSICTLEDLKAATDSIRTAVWTQELDI